ncbi:MAG: hypothetical protein KKB59_20225 [Spirochaetes bacterium]|nr:hypothetical protein [Spirochaetota bacterium]
MLQSLLEEMIPEHKPTDARPEWNTYCISPDCTCGTPGHRHLYINVDKEVAYCQRCGVSFTVEEILIALAGMTSDEARTCIQGIGAERPKRLRKRLEKLKASHGIDQEVAPRIRLPETMIDLNPLALRYLEDRNVSKAKAEELNMGVCTAGFWRDRLIVPVVMGGVTYGFEARAMHGPPKALSPIGRKRWIKEHKYKKVLYPVGFKSSRLLFGVDQDDGSMVVLTEGVFDALSVGSPGISMFGKKLSAVQTSLLRQYGKTEIYVMLDYDAYSDAKVICGQLVLAGFTVYLVRCLTDKDPGDMNQEEIQKALASAETVTRSRIVKCKRQYRRITGR